MRAGKQRCEPPRPRSWIGPSTVAAASLLLPALVLAQSASQPTDSAASAPPAVRLPDVDVFGASPLLGAGVDSATVPAPVAVLNRDDITRGGTSTPDAVRALEEQVGGVNLDSAAGNPYQPTLFYHGFEASPLQGTPQGLATYVDGVRFNQAFGDTVNWDLLPDAAIDQINLAGSNPVFGLNALGGALNVRLKNGFTYHGGQIEVSGGSFGTVNGDIQYGAQSGDSAAYVAASGVRAGGWRDLQSSDMQNFYGDLGWRGERAEVHLNLTLANSMLNGPGTSPVELLDADPKAQFTAPNWIRNRFMQVSLAGNLDLSDTLSVQAVTYYNNFLQRVANGNAASDTPCNDGSGLLCGDSGPSTTVGGATIPAFLGPSPFAYSELDTQTTNTNGYGVSLQATDTAPLFGLANHLVGGFSFDGARTEFDGDGYIGGITPVSRVYVGPGVLIDEPGTDVPVRTAISNAYYGVFAANTLNLTQSLALTVSGRFNLADIDLLDQNGGDLTGDHGYARFNPEIGLTYKLTPWLTAYADDAQANRAPTPAELSCAGPNESCSLANFFVGDPNLKQVVAHTVEAGLRGTTVLNNGGRLRYDAGIYRSDLDDDIVFVNSVVLNRAFFTNVGQTRRQGVDAHLQYDTELWSGYVSYAYTDATYRTGFVEAAGSNPAADASGNITINPGDRLPGIPAHQLKLGGTYHVTDRWTVEATGIARSGAYLFGDEANLTPKLPAYVTLNLGSSYKITPRVEVFATIDNVTNSKYYTYGTFAPTTAVLLAQTPNATNPRSYSPAAPVGGYGGLRVTF